MRNTQEFTGNDSLSLSGNYPPKWDRLNTIMLWLFNAVLTIITKRSYSGLENLPDEGALVVSNHLSEVDPLVLAHAISTKSRYPRGMGKVEIFRVPFLGRPLLNMGHIPVDRESKNPGAALGPAEAALRAGEIVVVYPEGTTNASPETGLLSAKTGPARLALQAGVPVVPVGQWGPHQVFRNNKLAIFRLPNPAAWFGTGRSPRRPASTLIMGKPISVEELRFAANVPGSERVNYQAVTKLIMERIAELVVEITQNEQTGVLGGGQKFPRRKHINKPVSTT